MSERPHHQRIAQVLRALNAPLLRENHCLFGGGTAIALRYGEYRESADIDFLVSDLASYRNLRQLRTNPGGIAGIVHARVLALLRQALLRAHGAYGQAIRQDLDKALLRLQTRQGWLERCMQAMAMVDAKAVVWQRLRALRRN